MYSIVGIIMQVISGVAVASFVVPLSRVRNWPWARSWLIYTVVGWLFLPWIATLVLVPDPVGLFLIMPRTLVFWIFFAGMLWGVGWMCWGAAVHYLGVSLGSVLCVGMYAMCVTIIPPVLMGESRTLTYLTSGNILQLGVVTGLIGMVICFYAGRNREVDAGAHDGIARQNQGAFFAIAAGFLCCFLPLGLYLGRPLADIATDVGVSPMWRHTGTLALMLTGGFAVMATLCLILLFQGRKKSAETNETTSAPAVKNSILAVSAGMLWFGHVMIYDLGKLLLHFFDYAAMPIYLAGVYIAAAMWGGILDEWCRVRLRTKVQIIAGFGCLFFAAGLMIFGAYLSAFGL